MISDDSGQKFKRSEMRKTWDNKWVHCSEWEPRQPQDFINARSDTLHAGVYREGVGDDTDGAIASNKLITSAGKDFQADGFQVIVQ